MIAQSSLLIASRILNQLIIFISIPIISRLYNPEIVGQWALVQALLTFLASTSLLSVEKSFPELSNEKYIVLRFFNTWLYSFFIQTFLFVMAIMIYDDMRLFYLPYCLLFVGNLLLVEIYSRLNLVKIYAVLMVLQTLIKVTFVIFLPFLTSEISVSNFVVAETVSGLAFLIFALNHLKTKLGSFDLQKIEIMKPDAFYRMYKKYILYSFPVSFVKTIVRRSTIVGLSAVSGEHQVGLYNYSNKVIDGPSSTIISTLRFLMAPRLSDTSSEIIREILQLQRMITFFCTPVIVIFFINSSQFFSFLLGAEWERVGYFFKFLVLIKFCALLISWFDRVFLYREKLKLQAVLEFIIDPATALIALSVLFYTTELSSFLLTLVVVRVSYFLIWWYNAFRAFGASCTKTLWDMSKIMFTIGLIVISGFIVSDIRTTYSEFINYFIYIGIFWSVGVYFYLVYRTAVK
jgi:O-antigen/teichoic acid export membrane protein